MQQFIQSVKSFVAWEWIGHVTKSLFKLASYIVELPMVASGVYIMIATGIPGANNPHWYNLAFGVLLSAPEVLAPGAFFRAESMQSRGKLKVARVTRWIAGFMLFFAALTFSSVMIFHFSNEWLQAIMFCRVMTALGYSIITRIDMDHGAMPVQQPPALQMDYWPIVAMAAHLQSQFEMKLGELASNQKTALIGMVNEQRLVELSNLHIHKFNLMDLQVQRLFSEFQALQEAPDCVAPEIDYEQLAKAILPHLRANIEPAVRAIWEEKQSQIQVAPAPQQIEARARKTGGSRATKQVDSEPQKASAHGTPESRLEAAYNVFLTNQVLVSGRLLAREAHVNRTYASKWLSQREKGGSESTTDPAIEAVVSVAPEP